MLKGKNKNKQKGQALLFVIVAVTLALTVGVSVSTRTLNLTQRVSRTDTSQRVIAAAEGGIERLLTQSDQFLDTMETNSPECTSLGTDASAYEGGSCKIEYTATAGDKITAIAVVDAEKFKFNDTDNYWFSLSPGYVKEVNLEGYTGDIEICWNNKDAAIYYNSYDCAGNIKKGGFYSNDFSYTGDVTGFTQKSSTREGYVGCGEVDLISNPYGLRIKAFYSSSKVSVFPTGTGIDTFPYQGYKITSKGQLLTEGEISDTKTILVYRSFPYAPSAFDYSIYTGNTLR